MLDAARYEVEQGIAWRNQFHRGGSARVMATAQQILAGESVTVDWKPSLDTGFFPGEPGYPSAMRIAYALTGGATTRASAATPLVKKGRLSKRLAAHQKATQQTLTAMAEAALTAEVERLSKLLPTVPTQINASARPRGTRPRAVDGPGTGSVQAHLVAASIPEVVAAISEAFGSLQTVATRRIAQARNVMLDIIVEETGISRREAERRLKEFDRSKGYDRNQTSKQGAAWTAAWVLIRRLRRRLERILFDPESFTGLADGGDLRTAGIVESANQSSREALTVAGGADPIPVDGGTDQQNASWAKAVGGGLLSAVLLNALTQDTGVAFDDEAFIWRWGPGPAGGVLPQHQDRDGVKYTGPEDEALNVSQDPFLGQIATYDYPGIHFYCGCTKELLVQTVPKALPPVVSPDEVALAASGLQAHLPGQHNQADHGHGGIGKVASKKDTSGEVGGGIASKRGIFLDMNDGGKASIREGKSGEWWLEREGSGGKFLQVGEATYRGKSYRIFEDQSIALDKQPYGRKDYRIAIPGTSGEQLPDQMSFGAHALSKNTDGYYVTKIAGVNVGVKGDNEKVLKAAAGQIAAVLDHVAKGNQVGDTQELKVFVGAAEVKAALGRQAKGFVAAANVQVGLNDPTIKGRVFLPMDDKKAVQTIRDQMVSPDGTNFMHKGYAGREVQALIAHELAHIEDKAHVGQSAVNRERTVLLERSRDIGASNFPGVSGYGRTNKAERYAEAKSLWQIGTDAEMGMDRDRLYAVAERFGWTR